MKSVYDFNELAEEVQEKVKAIAPYKEGRIRYFHYPRNEMPMIDGAKYIFAKRFGYNLNNHRMITAAIDHSGRVGVSLCSKQDKYNRKIGNAIASGRLLKFDRIRKREDLLERFSEKRNDSN